MSLPPPETLAWPRRDIPGQDPEIARLSAMVMALLSELTVTRERLDTVERLAAKAGLFPRDAVETFEPDPAEQAARDAVRKRQIAKVMRPLREDAERAVRQAKADLAKAASRQAAADQILEAEVMS